MYIVYALSNYSNAHPCHRLSGVVDHQLFQLAKKKKKKRNSRNTIFARAPTIPIIIKIITVDHLSKIYYIRNLSIHIFFVRYSIWNRYQAYCGSLYVVHADHWFNRFSVILHTTQKQIVTRLQYAYTQRWPTTPTIYKCNLEVENKNRKCRRREKNCMKTWIYEEEERKIKLKFIHVLYRQTHWTWR